MKMMLALRPPVERRRGVATVEFALAAPILFLLLFGIFEIAHAFMVQHQIKDAARQGCRVGVCPYKFNADVTATVDTALSKAGITGASTTILVNDAAGDVGTALAGDEISVRITLTAADVSLYPGGGFILEQLSAVYSLRHQ
ncbi:MAG: TadE/TadG family type IV pilus assembly protein [Planctomycetaceae bacterium]|nr:TadE/TadG family type IV pilus assembly protein [Planctomycetaceae bacterium]